MKFILSFILLIISFCAYAGNPNAYEIISLDDISLNRTATKLSNEELSTLHGSDFGFQWNNSDNNTNKWRPQGITSIVTPESNKFIAVSWYGRPGYEKRGVRISFANISNEYSIDYRHVLLVDENYKTFKGMHAGGITYIDGLLHVADTRKIPEGSANSDHSQKIIHTFSIDDIKHVPTSDRKKFHNYAYILQKKSSYNVPIKPSFMSYDNNEKKVLIGTFKRCSEATAHIEVQACLTNSQNQLSLYGLGELHQTKNSFSSLFCAMQGAASTVDSYGNNILWISSSYGRNNKSRLYIVNVDKRKLPSINNYKGYKSLLYPPGLEDMHVSNSNNIWMLTEFGPHEGESNNRIVFSTRKEYLLP